MWRERGEKKEREREREKGGNGFFHFKSHFVQSQMTVFKDALSFSPQDFRTAAPHLMVRYLSPSPSSPFSSPLSLSPSPSLPPSIRFCLEASRCVRIYTVFFERL